MNHAEAVARINANGYHRILMPEATSFADVFSAYAPYGDAALPFTVPAIPCEDVTYGTTRSGKARRRVYRGTMRVGPYCSIDLSQIGGPRHASLAVQPSEAAMAALEPRLMASPRDAVSFQIIAHESGHALVVASNSLILASSWLAYIDPTTIPAVV